LGGTLFAYFAIMTEPFRLRLFGDIYVEETSDKALVLYKGDKVISPNKYAYIWDLAPRAYALRQVADHRIDIVFESGQMLFNAFYAHNLGPAYDDDTQLIAVLVTSGTLILDDWGHYKVFVSGYPRITTVYGDYLIVYRPEGVIPFVQIYDLRGNIIAEGTPMEAIQEVHNRRPSE
jgi:hypothetical protein